MTTKEFDTMIIGHVSLDEIIYNNELSTLYGGAVVYSGYSAIAGGNNVAIFTKYANDNKKDVEELFNDQKFSLFLQPTKNKTSIRNEYLSEDRERRICTALSVADQFTIDEIPDVKSKIYHLAGLIVGDYSDEMIKYLSKKGKVAVDVQGYLRKNDKGNMFFEDWKEKKKYLPYIHFLKTDAAEAEIMTGETDRLKAAKILYEWGAKEIMITYNTEVLVYDGTEFYTSPLVPRQLSGRTGRGDTCFSAYITERLNRNIPESIEYAAALVSLKMETPGPFRGTREDVEKYIEQFYR